MAQSCSTVNPFGKIYRVYTFDKNTALSKVFDKFDLCTFTICNNEGL